MSSPYNIVVCDVAYVDGIDNHGIKQRVGRVLIGSANDLRVCIDSELRKPVHAFRQFIVGPSHGHPIQLILHSALFRMARGIRFRFLQPRLYIAQDNTLLDWRFDDWGISLAPGDANNFQNYTCIRLEMDMAKKGEITYLAKAKRSTMEQKTKFCSFIYDNSGSYARQSFFHVLSCYARVDALGNVLRNTPNKDGRYGPDWFNAVCDLHRPYKFAICFENLQAPHYHSEKLLSAFAAKTVPIYLGDPHITQYYNPDAFIHARDFSSPEALADYVMAVHKDEARYRAYIEADCLQPAWRSKLENGSDSYQLFLQSLLAQLKSGCRLPKMQKNNVARELFSRLRGKLVETIIEDFGHDYRPGIWNKDQLEVNWCINFTKATP